MLIKFKVTEDLFTPSIHNTYYPTTITEAIDLANSLSDGEVTVIIHCNNMQIAEECGFNYCEI